MQAIRVFSCVLLLVLLGGCGTVYLDGPPGVRLLASDAPVSVKAQRTVWFWLWGNKPLSDPYAATLIKENGLSEARVTMTNTAADSIISVFTGIVGFPRRTIIVEGNR